MPRDFCCLSFISLHFLKLLIWYFWGRSVLFLIMIKLFTTFVYYLHKGRVWFAVVIILGGILGAAVCNKWFLKTIAGHYFQHRLKVGCNNFKYFCTFSGWMIASTIRLPLIMIFHNCVLVLLTITSPFSLWLTFSMLQNDEKSSLSWVYSLIRFFLVWFDIFEYVCVCLEDSLCFIMTVNCPQWLSSKRASLCETLISFSKWFQLFKRIYVVSVYMYIWERGGMYYGTTLE